MLMWLLLALGLAILLVRLLCLAFSDCDLTLQWATKFGRPIDSLRGRVVWITGASSGIGEHLAYQLAAAGCRLVLSARRTDELHRVKKLCLLSGQLREEDVLVLTLDSLQFDTHAAAVNTVLQHFNQIDILVNNAGRTQRAGWLETSVSVDRAVLEVNVLGVLSLTRAVLPHMVQRRSGHVAVMSSTAGKLGAAFSGSYTGSKHALHGWFEALRVEMFQHNVHVTMLCPGPVFSNLLQHAFTDTPGQTLGGSMKAGERRMSTERCAFLCGVALANVLDEAWMALHPILLFMYAAQYTPTIFRNRFKRTSLAKLKQMREGK